MSGEQKPLVVLGMSRVDCIITGSPHADGRQIVPVWEIAQLLHVNVEDLEGAIITPRAACTQRFTKHLAALLAAIEPQQSQQPPQQPSPHGRTMVIQFSFKDMVQHFRGMGCEELLAQQYAVDQFYSLQDAVKTMEPDAIVVLDSSTILRVGEFDYKVEYVDRIVFVVDDKERADELRAPTRPQQL